MSILQKQMEKMPINEQNGTGWYKWLFTAAPDARKYFKNAENIDPKVIPDDERFQKQGIRFLTKMHAWVNAYADDKEGFQKSVDLLVKGHKRFNIPAELYLALGNVWVDYLTSHIGSMDKTEKEAWDEFNKALDASAQRILVDAK